MILSQMTEIASLIGLLLGALMGLGALISPQWATGVVRLGPVAGRPGGYAEFRATYGGLLLMSHLVAFLIVLHTPPVISLFAALPFCAGWFGAALGRSASLLLDRKHLGGRGLNPVWIGTEIAMGVLIGLPLPALFL